MQYIQDREITEIIIHCSATKEGLDIKAHNIDMWHRRRGFRKIGYHYVIDLDGTVEKGRPLWEIGAHCKDHNAQSVGICYIGGLDRKGFPKDTRTKEQKVALRELVRELKLRFPQATIHGHKEFARKACPCFPMRAL